MTNLFFRNSVLFVLLLMVSCKPDSHPNAVINEPATTTNPIDEYQTDRQLIEAQSVLGHFLNITLVEATKSSFYNVLNQAPPTCPTINFNFGPAGNCGDGDDIITIDFGTNCLLSGGAEMSGVLNIKSFAPCEGTAPNQIPSLIGSGEGPKMILTFTTVNFNGYTIEYQPGIGDGGIQFWNGGSTTNPFFVFLFPPGDSFKVTHPNGGDYTIFYPPGFDAPSLEITPSDPMISLDITELDAAEYEIKILADLNPTGDLVNYWRVATFFTGNTTINPDKHFYIITDDGEDLIMSPQCNGIKGGTLQVRSFHPSPTNATIIREYEYGYELTDEPNLTACGSMNPTPANACEDYVWICNFDEFESCDNCKLVKCFKTI